jgi:hypothetical protein
MQRPMMMQHIKLAACVVAITLTVSGLALADDDDYYRGGNRTQAHQYGFQNGYQDGLRRGQHEARENDPNDFQSRDWRKASRGYQPRMAIAMATSKASRLPSTTAGDDAEMATATMDTATTPTRKIITEAGTVVAETQPTTTVCRTVFRQAAKTRIAASSSTQILEAAITPTAAIRASTATVTLIVNSTPTDIERDTSRPTEIVTRNAAYYRQPPVQPAVVFLSIPASGMPQGLAGLLLHSR